MRVLLIKLDHGTLSSGLVPDSLGLLKLSTFYKAKGHDVRLKSCKDSLPYGWRPDLICFSPIFKFRLKKDFGYIKAFMKKYPKASIHVGGVQATLDPNLFRSVLGPRVDVFVGLQPEFDTLPPDYDAIGKTYSYGFTSRGCPRRCDWCIVPKNEGKISTVDNWQACLGEGHKEFICMDNNTLACGIDWVESVFNEMQKREMKIDFNQAVDCRLFCKGEEMAQLFKKHKGQLMRLRFAWDSKQVDKKAIKTLELIEKYGLRQSNDTWLVMYGYDEAPEDLWRRMKALASYNQITKPMLFKSLETGKDLGGWAKDFARYVNMISGQSNIIAPHQFKQGLFGRNETEFLRVLEIGNKIVEMRRMMKSDGVKKTNYDAVLEYIQGKTKRSVIND